MSDWDDSSDQLEENLARILAYAIDDARRRSKPTLEDTLNWHKDLMHGLEIPPKDRPGITAADIVGRFRGMAPLEKYNVVIRGYLGVRADLVPVALKAFEQELQGRVKLLDAQIDAELTERNLTAKQTLEVLKLCAWAHAEWVRIHPFANGNGRTARIWANYLAARYALPPFVQLRPRPGADYEAAGAAAMEGYWERTFLVFLCMYEEYDE
jgi:Fic family protein